MKYLSTITFVFSFCIGFCQLGEEVGPLTGNPALQSKAKLTDLQKANPGTFDSTFIYTSDTLELPFFDDFSSNHFQEYSSSFTDPGVTFDKKYQLLDLNDTPLSNDSLYVEIETYRRVVDLELLTVVDYPFAVQQVKLGDLSSYPVVYATTNVYPPFYITDTLLATNGTDLSPDTTWLTPTVVQDSATQFFSPINDFSSYWLDDDAFHNYTMAVNPWSLGVVTFDGLDRFGYPYALGTTLTNYADYLTSKPIDMSSVSPSDSVYFSFMSQSKGFCDQPESTDSLVLEFYAHDLGQWNYMWSISGSALDTFRLTHIPITNVDYFKDGFQFRFKNYGGLSGSLDHFHIDFVHLRSIPGIGGFSDTFLRDVAFSYPITTLLSDYTAVPWDHYVNVSNHSTVISDQVKVVMANSFPGPINSLDGTLEVYYGGVFEGTTVPLISDLLCDDISDNYQGLDIPYSNHDLQALFAFDPSKTGVWQEFEIRSQATGGTPNYAGNDSTITRQRFENYYSYDDGSAELAYGPTGVQARLAIQYVAYEADSLLGVDIHFVPSVTDVSNNLFLLTVWGDNNGEPGEVLYEDNLFVPRTPEYEYAQNTFKSYMFPDDSLVPVDEIFYVGWRQLDPERLNVGLDMNVPNNDHTFYSIDGGSSWNTSVFEGSVMIRPVFSTGMNSILGVESNPKKDVEVSIYPNPTKASVHIAVDGTFTGVELLTMQGQLLIRSEVPSIDMSALPKGMYFLRVDGEPTLHKVLRD